MSRKWLTIINNILLALYRNSNIMSLLIRGLRMTGEDIKKLRKQAGLTQKELGKMVGIGQSQISDFENGRRRLSKINGIAIECVLNNKEGK